MFPIQQGTQHTHPMSSPISKIIDVRRPGESWVWGHLHLRSVSTHFIGSPKSVTEWDWMIFCQAYTSFTAVLLETLILILHLLNHR